MLDSAEFMNYQITKYSRGGEILQQTTDARRLLIILTVAFALSHLDRQILAITLNDIGNEFQLSDLQLGTLSGVAFAFIYVVLGFPVAKITRKGNRKLIVTSALSLWSAMTALTGLANSFASVFLARVGVGVGEAGCVPPSHSMISDVYPPEKRAGALAFYSAGANVGIFLAFLVGGILASKYGWRSAFFVAGIPGLFWAVWMMVSLKEPMNNEVVQSPVKEITEKPSIAKVGFLLFADLSIRHAFIGTALTAMIGHGAVAWVSTFLIRTHELSTAQAGTYLAIVIGVLGAVGTWSGGVMADRFGVKDPSWRLKFVAITIVIAKPIAIAFYLTDNTFLALCLFILPAAAGGIFIGPTLSQVYSRIDENIRPMATAIFMLVVNLIGLGIGPVLVGLISDILNPSMGTDSLRYALISIQFFGFCGAMHFWLAGNAVAKDS